MNEETLRLYKAIKRLKTNPDFTFFMEEVIEKTQEKLLPSIRVGPQSLDTTPAHAHLCGRFFEVSRIRKTVDDVDDLLKK
jgi:hypothetical protein